jgi:hypothetical protein
MILATASSLLFFSRRRSVFSLRGTRYYSVPLIIGGVIAWHSHLLLDTFYNHGQGLAIFWPFSSGRLALPFPFFRTMETKNYFSASNLQIFAIEGLFYGAILIVALIVRFVIIDRRVLRANQQ